MTICYSAGVEPVLVISKIDLSSENEIEKAINELEARDKKIKYILLSNTTRQGLDQIIGLYAKRQNILCRRIVRSRQIDTDQ